MTKLGFLFPGQGSQYVGMGKELYDTYAEAREVFDAANDVLGFDLKKIVFEGPEETLRQTQYTQPAIFVTSFAAYKVFISNFKSQISNVSYAAGHSLGEYSACAAAGMFSFKEGLSLVKARGEYIQSASAKVPGTMAAIIGLDSSKTAEICLQSAAAGACEAVNFNSPGQIVIAGTVAAVQKAVELATAAGATKALVLNVSGPFHSSLMSPAAEMMKAKLSTAAFSQPVFPVITNCDAQVTDNSALLADKLTRQIDHPVLWEDSIKTMIGNNVTVFVEIGPGRVLSGLMRRIDKTKKTYNIEDKKSLEKTLGDLQSI